MVAVERVEAGGAEAEEEGGYVGSAVGSLVGYAAAGARWFRPLS